ncbi:prolyl oligopeptidase family serine peptidase, partial [uncultured Flavobacterium sp.]|uniref:S9 family peptidase n=1 Tax=uncultured Flavobacterium sp. TaxID=165435 RepID=UPI0025FCAD7B
SKNLIILNLKTFQETLLQNVVEYQEDPTQKRLSVIIQDNNNAEVKWTPLSDAISLKTIKQKPNAIFTGLAWNMMGESLAFLEKAGNIQPGIENYTVNLQCILPKSKILYTLEVSDTGFPPESYIPRSKLHVSNDGTTVFFDISPLPKRAVDVNKDTEPTVEIWHNAEKQLPPSKFTETSFMEKPKWSAWTAGSGLVRILESYDYPNVILTGDDKSALVYSGKDYLPRHKYGGDYTDLYIMDIATGERRCFAKKIANEYERVIISPHGKYIAYFKEKNWWLYDIARHKSVNLSESSNVLWYNTDFDRPREKGPYGCAGWTADDKFIILYDQFDVWLFATGNNAKERLTEGRESNTTWRIWNDGPGALIRDSYSGFTKKVWSLSSGFTLHLRDNSTLEEGFGFYSKSKGLRKIIKHQAKILDILPSDDGSTFVYSESRFDSPPSIWVANLTGETNKIVQSNKQQQDYHWGKSELVQYQVDGRSLNGALFYPAGYIEGKQYPMIVNIYEKKSSHLHDYVLPSIATNDGINVTNFTLAGYFVLLPDIAFGPNTPGDSAVQCVTAAVEKVLQKGDVDKSKMGLIGHSFGGYLAALILSKTNLFHAAVAGSMVTDPVGYYLTLDGWGDSNMWRFEEYQMRIRAPYYGNAFHDNSPVMNAHKISAPLLLWVGDKDGNIPWWESMKLNNALWRLNKDHVYLVYRDEDHVLQQQPNKIDLCRRVHHWFDVHLKDCDAEQWAK